MISIPTFEKNFPSALLKSSPIFLFGRTLTAKNVAHHLRSTFPRRHEYPKGPEIHIKIGYSICSSVTERNKLDVFGKEYHSSENYNDERNVHRVRGKISTIQETMFIYYEI